MQSSIPTSLNKPTNSRSADFTQEMLHNKVHISDIKDMYCQTPRKNATPYEQNLIKEYNTQVYDWKASILEHKCDENSRVIAGQVVPMWQMYWEGVMVSRAMNSIQSGLVEGFNPDKFAKLVEIFSSDDPVKLVQEYGTIALVFLYHQFHYQITIWGYQQKWDRVFSKSSDPKDWEAARAKHSKLFRGEEAPPGVTQELIRDAHEMHAHIVKLQPAVGKDRIR